MAELSGVEKPDSGPNKQSRWKFLKYRKRMLMFSSFLVYLLNAILLQIYTLKSIATMLR